MSTPENVERVRDLLQQNCQITVRMFCELLYISKTACHRILPVDPGNPAVLIKFSCALFSFVLLQLDVCRLLFSNCEQLIVCGSEWNFGTSPVLSAATLHSTGWPTTYGPRQCYQLLHSILQGDQRLMDLASIISCYTPFYRVTHDLWTSPVLSAATLHSTGWPTTYGHYCRGWFRRSLWSKTFI